MKPQRIWPILLVPLVSMTIGTVAYWSMRPHPAYAVAPTSIRIGISPFQDTLVPVVGEKKGWYRKEGLNAEIRILGWTEVMEALSAGHVDVAINNISSVVATHERNPEIVYWHGLNPFDDGFALMIRPNGKLKTLAQFAAGASDRREAVALAENFFPIDVINFSVN
jgi:ABC-type nitrate/sulfonate/bicarbonate transport system substrate-binding protein